MNKVIINLATGRYLRGQERLKQTCKKFSPQIPVMSWQNEFMINMCPKHSVNPYAFKPYAFIEAMAKNYELIFWMDASCYLVKDIQPLFDIIERDGYFMHEAGHWVNKWTNDFQRNYFGKSEEELSKIPMFTAGCFGLNVKSEIGMKFLSRWLDAANNGAFKGDWSNSRHDMTCGSIIAQDLGMKYQYGENYLQYKAPEEANKNETITIGLQGLA